jgi:carbon storage regulator
MLVLTRKYQEKIRIGQNITITVLRTKGKAVRLGIEAPSDVPVVRGELKLESDSDAPLAEAVTVGAGSAPGAANGMRPREIGTESSWTVRTRPHAIPRRRSLREVARVGHSRVPRRKVAQLMPSLVSGNDTIRELLDQRSANL